MDKGRETHSKYDQHSTPFLNSSVIGKRRSYCSGSSSLIPSSAPSRTIVYFALLAIFIATPWCQAEPISKPSSPLNAVLESSENIASGEAHSVTPIEKRSVSLQEYARESDNGNGQREAAYEQMDNSDIADIEDLLNKRTPSRYSFGIGRRSIDPYYLDSMEMNKRAVDLSRYLAGSKRLPQRFQFGIGKKSRYNFGIGKRSVDEKRRYNFGIGK